MLRQLISGLATYVPGTDLCRKKGSGGAKSARYCYSVWLRHLVMAKKNGLDAWPRVVAELGPGDALGTGYAALISGSDRYVALDVVAFADGARRVDIFDELVELFTSRASIPGDEEFPGARPRLEDYGFPADVLDDGRLQYALEKSRIQKIRDAVANPESENSPVRYVVPWYDAKVIEAGSADMILSQAVLEHVDDLSSVYKAMHSWLRPTGYASHQVDFKSHGLATEWNGHWAYSDIVWRLIRGRKPFLLNREPHSTHIRLMTEEGYKIVCDSTTQAKSAITMKNLAPRFRSMTDEDLITSDAFLQAIKL